MTMITKQLIAVDLANVYDRPAKEGRELLRTLAWGDRVEVLSTTSKYVEIQTPVYKDLSGDTVEWTLEKGYLLPGRGLKTSQLVVSPEKSRVLKVDIVDVQQGDASVIETPDGKVILVDGGDNKLFARYLASRFRGTSLKKPQVIDLMLVTHGDADHFKGLMEIIKSEGHKEAKKRLFIEPLRVYHNGLVKRPTKSNGVANNDVQMLGATTKVGKDTFITGLEDDLLGVQDKEMNLDFKAWKKMLRNYKDRYRKPASIKRIQFGDKKAFHFLNGSGATVDVLGPLVQKVGDKPALKFLGAPPKGPRIGHDSLSLQPMNNGALSASHTINGHSIVFRLAFGGFSFLFCGDLNDEASRFLAQRHAGKLRSTVLKVPHHGSGDFSGGFFRTVAPVVSVISSGDENTRKEYIHPRATLMGALGQHSSVPEPLIFCTELVAFFQVEDMARLLDPKKGKKRGDFFAFSRTSFGIVKMRTDGKRLLVYTNSGNVKLKEVYAYTLDNKGLPVPAAVIKA